MEIKIGNNIKKHLSSKMFGLFFEDINYAVDGGLYAEMIENRQFAFKKATSTSIEKQYHVEDAPEYGWSIFSGEAKMTFNKGNALSEANPYYMNLDVAQNQNVCFKNKAYDGIYMNKGKKYHLTVFLRIQNYSDYLEVFVVGKKYMIACAQIEYDKNNHGWQKCSVDLVALNDLEKGDLLISQKSGSVDYGYISLIPEDAIAGLFRPDLFAALKETRPGFLRFPGGCIVEGANLENRYQWKNTLGNNWDRVWNWSRWCVHDVTMGKGEPLYYPYINQSYGIGFYEYFLLCELLAAKPLPVLNVGLACQFQSDELVDISSTEFDSYIQDALDLIEFANGDSDSYWGSIRVKMGHREPFNLEYLGLGNEQWETPHVDFFARYKKFESAIHAKYPEIKLIGSAGPDVVSEKYTMAWDFYLKEIKSNANFTDAVDEHYYMPPQWFYDHHHMYDHYSDEISVFAGEYAAHTNNKENNLEAALAEASFMCGLERNGHIIKFASAAPLFARIGYEVWKPDLIFFDGKEVFKTPSFYVQSIFGQFSGDASVDFSVDEEGIYSSCSKDAKHYYVKIVNPTAKVIPLDKIVIENQEVNLVDVIAYQLTGELKDDYKEVRFETTSLNNILPYSVTVIIL